MERSPTRHQAQITGTFAEYDRLLFKPALRGLPGKRPMASLTGPLPIMSTSTPGPRFVARTGQILNQGGRLVWWCRWYCD